jgi:hypothetical protein
MEENGRRIRACHGRGVIKRISQKGRNRDTWCEGIFG